MGQREIIVDSFAGGGGASLGISIALGRCPDVAINHDAEAIAMHAANHPDTRHFTEDVWKLSPRQVTRGRLVGLLWASPDCFPAGTLVLTGGGLKPIEAVTVGEYVLTHKNRWRQVTSTMSKTAETVAIRGHGHWGLVTTPEHQIYSKRITHRYPKAGPDGKRPGGGSGIRELVENPYWPKAQDMAGKLWATPAHVPALPMPLDSGADFGPNFFYFLGRWVGDGSLNKGDVEICCGAKEFDILADHFNAMPLLSADGEKIRFRVVDHGTSKLIVWGCARLVDWLRASFGDSCETKHLPAWLLGAQASWRRNFLNGYVDSDGHIADGVITTSSVSRSLSVGIRLLAASLGFSPAAYLTEGKPGQIEGRNFVAKDSYRIRWREDLQAEQCHRDSIHLFSPVREVQPTGRVEQVYCLGVEEDESYTADGIVVHNCKHFSRAKGGKPVEKRIRSLAWVVIKWAAEAAPRLIILENVREFEDWGPLLPAWRCTECNWRGTEGQTLLVRTRRRCPRCESLRLIQTQDLIPDPDRKGLTFRRFAGRLRNLGYAVEWKTLNAADYGAPTHRRRLFLVARNDGAPIVWPERTHGDSAKLDRGAGLFGEPLQPWRTAAECIDWSIPCPSIFDRKRPLAEATMRRIALGVKRYVLENPRPFLVTCNHGGPEFRGQGLERPLPTVTASRDAHGIVTPLIASLAHGGQGTFGDSRSHDVREPMRTIHAGGGNHAVVAPCLARIGQTQGNGKYTNGVDEPLTTIVSKAEHLLIAPTMIQTGYGERPGQTPRTLDLGKPMGTAVGGCKQGLVAAFLAKHYGGVVGVPADTPLPTTTERGTQNQVVAANLIHLNHGQKQWSSCDDPMRTVTTGNHAFLVYSFLVKYFGTAVGQPIDAPLHTVTGKDRFGLVTVTIEGQPYVIVDIGMRMLTPRELARGQGFPDSYVMTGTNTSQVARIGNSVPPVMARVLVEANYSPSACQA